MEPLPADGPHRRRRTETGNRKFNHLTHWGGGEEVAAAASQNLNINNFSPKLHLFSFLWIFLINKIENY